MRRKVVLVLLILAACRAMPAPETPPTQEESAVSIVTQTPEAASPLPGSGETPIPASETPSPNVPPIAGPTPLPIVDLPLMGVEMINNGSFISKVPIAAQAGVHWVRLNGLFWSDIEPTEGERDWDQLSLFEERIQAASAAGLQMIVIVRSTPAWAQARPGYYCGPVHPGKLATFGKFMHDLVSRYSQPPFNVRYWELGNEPDIDPRHVPPDNIFGCWGDENSPYYGGEYYAEMLKAVYPQVKAADPDTQVLVGGLLLDCDPNNPPELQPGQLKDCTPAKFLEGILINGGDYFDGVSFHAYDFYYPEPVVAFGNLNWSSGWSQNGAVPVLAAKTRYLRSLLAQYGYTDKFLMNTETALLCGRDQNEPECQTESFQRVKAGYVAQTYAAALAEGLRANVWYSLVTTWRFSGLADGGLQPFPAYAAYQFAATALDGALFWGPVGEFEGVFGYKFKQDDDAAAGAAAGDVWVLWSLDGEPHTIELPSPPDAVYDVFGAPLDAGRVLEVTSSPLYVEWAP